MFIQTGIISSLAAYKPVSYKNRSGGSFSFCRNISCTATIAFRYMLIPETNSVVTGRILSITDFGVFVEVNSQKCLLHISKITGSARGSSSIAHQLSKVFIKDENIRVKVVRIEENRIALDWEIDDEQNFNRALQLLVIMRRKKNLLQNVLDLLLKKSSGEYNSKLKATAL